MCIRFPVVYMQGRTYCEVGNALLPWENTCGSSPSLTVVDGQQLHSEGGAAFLAGFVALQLTGVGKSQKHHHLYRCVESMKM